MRSFDIVNNVICQTGVERNGEGKVTDPKPQGSPRERCQARAHEDEADINEGEGRQGHRLGRDWVAVQGLHQLHRPGPGHPHSRGGYRCERWVTPDGTVLTASLPEGIQGHFGSDLCRFILAQYYQGQVTVVPVGNSNSNVLMV
jgi:hypothetical protein